MFITSKFTLYKALTIFERYAGWFVKKVIKTLYSAGYTQQLIVRKIILALFWFKVAQNYINIRQINNLVCKGFFTTIYSGFYFTQSCLCRAYLTSFL